MDYLEQLESHRLSSTKKMWRATIGCLVFFLAVEIIVELSVKDDDFEKIFWGIFPLFFCVGVTPQVYNHYKKRIFLPCKQMMLPRIISEHFPYLDYLEQGAIPEWEFNAMGLFPKVDLYKGQDLLTGAIDDIACKFCMVHARKEVESRNSHGQSTTHYETLFQGVLLSILLPQKLAGEIRITPKRGGALARLSLDYVELENPKFKQAFNIYASDQVEARYLLTPIMMESILCLEEILGGISIAFLNQRIYMAFSQRSDFFEPSHEIPFNDPYQEKRIHDNIDLVAEIARLLMAEYTSARV